MSLVESGPGVWRQTRKGFSGEIRGIKETIFLSNPGNIEIIWFRGQPYERDEHGKLSPASDELRARLRELEVKKGK